MQLQYGKSVSENTIKKIQELIDKGSGDIERLHRILNSLQNEQPLELSDKQYIESLSSTESEAKYDSITFENTSESINEPDNEPNSGNIPEANVVSKVPKINRKKIVIAGIVAAAIFFSYIGADAYAVSSLQIKPHQGNQYAISDMVLHIQAQVCNPSYFPVSFHNYQISAIYKSKVLETASIDGITIYPKSYTLLDGTFTIDKQAISEIANLGSGFNATDAKVTTKLDAPIFGIIPFTINKDYSGTEFANIVKNGPPGGYQC
jgi:hypothetical protein